MPDKYINICNQPVNLISFNITKYDNIQYITVFYSYIHNLKRRIIDLNYIMCTYSLQLSLMFGKFYCKYSVMFGILIYLTTVYNYHIMQRQYRKDALKPGWVSKINVLIELWKYDQSLCKYPPILKIAHIFP